ncbi:MAG: OmpA family protein [Alphaproteobacteria bacterium]|nr:OmpA family protein [Alphaproteobacteria bacterium]
MKHLKNYALLLFAGLALSNCAYFDAPHVEEDALQVHSQTIDLMGQSENAGFDIDPAAAIARNTDGRVQIFSLDEVESSTMRSLGGSRGWSSGGSPGPVSDGDGAMNIAPLRAVSPPGQLSAPEGGKSSSVFSADPSVKVFSLDDNLAGMAPLGVGALTPENFEPAPMYAGGPNISVIYFDHDSHTLNAEALGILSQLSEAFNPAYGQGISVEGHASVTANYADDKQREIVNLKISMDRALAVSRALIERGVPAEAIRVLAWGATRPPRELNGRTPEEAARRVEISG